MKYQWCVFIATLDPTEGSEQAGRRPVLVISSEESNRVLPVVNVLPLTSRKPNRTLLYPNEAALPVGAGGLPVDSVVLTYQIRTLDKRRLGRCMGAIVDPELQERILDALGTQRGVTITSLPSSDHLAPA